MLQLHGDDLNFHAQLTALYVAEWPRHKDVLHAVANGLPYDNADLFHHMHMLVSLTGNLALLELEAACRQLHDLLRQNNPPDHVRARVGGILHAGNTAASQFAQQLEAYYGRSTKNLT